MSTNVNPVIYWTPRILSILFVVFLSLFSLDVISPELSTGQIIKGMFMHNIPTLILLIVVIISWKHEIVGGIAFILAGFSYIALLLNSGVPWYLGLSWSLIISGPAFLIGFLFLVNWRKKRHLSQGDGRLE